MNFIINASCAAVMAVLPYSIASAELKIAVVNAVKVLESAPQAEAASKRLESEFASRKKKLEDSQKSLKTKEDKLAKDGSIMSESERSKLEKDVLNGRRDLKRELDEFREDLTLRRNEELGKFQKNVSEAIQAIAKEEGYDLILGDVIYAKDQLNITSKVVSRLQSSYKK